MTKQIPTLLENEVLVTDDLRVEATKNGMWIAIGDTNVFVSRREDIAKLISVATDALVKNVHR